MEYNIFSEIKERVNMLDIVKGYGLDVNRSGFCNCPFHAEKTPSMKIYEKGFKCFGCGEGGDQIAFVQKFFNLGNPLDAAKKINEDFGLGLDFQHKPTRQEFASTRNLIEERKQFEREETAAYNQLVDYFKILRDYGQKYVPHEGEYPDKRFFEFLQNFEKTDYILNEFLEQTREPIEARKKFLQSYKSYIENVKERLVEIKKEERQAEQIINEVLPSVPEEKVQKPLHQTIVINAFGGPGAGKTTACLDIVLQLKKRGYTAEYVPEYAKELVWDGNSKLLDGSINSQKAILSEQKKRLDRLIGKVDFVVTDAPLPLNTIYLDPPNKEHTQNIMSEFKKYDNFCFVVERNPKLFEQEGRIQSLEESIIKDSEIVNLLSENKIYFKTYNHDSLDKVVTNSIRTHERITGISKETPIGEKITPKNVVGEIIGNTNYKNIQDKFYLKYSNVIAPQITEKLTQSGISFSGKVYPKLTTFTINSKDAIKVRQIAEDIAKSFVDRNRPQLIPSRNQQRPLHTIPQKQKTAATRQQEMSL